ncbi:hypothetical protein LCGC14_1251440 [marine sediment metagenome]|uniref:Uncharacterized protein n=1 Tax=marine sediment metagenome TaxID=412755 RepID=A0A0F9L6I0_9ZZZZ
MMWCIKCQAGVETNCKETKKGDYIHREVTCSTCHATLYTYFSSKIKEER